MRIEKTLALAVLAAASMPAGAQVGFSDVTTAAFPAGLPAASYMWGDCDGDGDEDLLAGVTNVFLNDGPPAWGFTKRTDVGALAASPCSQAQWIDIDNDGDLDVFGIGAGNNERLYLNDGSCRFTDVSDFNGDGTPDDLGDGSPSTTAAAGDYDADGYLDLFVGNYERNCGGSPTICADCTVDRLWRNLGNRKFQNAYGALGMESVERSMAGKCAVSGAPCSSDAQCAPFPQDSCKMGLCARSSQWVDYNNDGWLDLYVGNYRLDPNFLWQNDGGAGFSQVSLTANKNADGEESGGAWGHTLGVDWADFDNDGDMDVYVADLAHGIYILAFGHDISLLYESSGAPNYRFTDWRPQSGMKPWPGLAQPDWCETSPAWADYDLDGDQDIYVTHIYETSTLNSSTLYSNDGDRTFTDTTAAHGLNLGLYHNYSASWCDYDQDGDPDLVTFGATAPTGQPWNAHLYRNDGASARAWVQIGLRGLGAGGTNRFGVGGRVTATHAGRSQIREVQGGHGYHTSRNSSIQTFGFGAVDPDFVDSVSVRWTTRQTESWSLVPTRLRFTTWEGGAVHRGPAPAGSLPRLAGALLPFHDRVLTDGQNYFYSVVEVPGTLYVEKDPARGTVALSMR